VLNPVDITEEEQKAIDENVARLRQGVETWNHWRSAKPKTDIDLRGINLNEINYGTGLSKVNFSYVKLSNANLCYADLSMANLSMANLNGVNLYETDLSNADLKGAKLTDADMKGAKLNSTDLFDADFTNTDLSGVDLSDANLCGANFTNSRITKVKWNPKTMRGKYKGLRGLDSSYGNALFKRAAVDQDYLDTLEDRWKERKGLTFLFKLWGLIDYGRSIGSVIVIAFTTIALFGLTYSIFPGLLGLDCVPNTFGCNHHSWFTPFYFSIVTFTTLGFGDITPKILAGELVVSLEVVLGYLVLGLLISVLADKVVRRS
jgi:uncharacterized protein YjbI with pentapeptide repeats